MEDGLRELSAALTRGTDAPSFHIFVGQKALDRTEKSKLLRYLRQTYLTDKVESVEVRATTSDSFPVLLIRCGGTESAPGYLTITADRADEGGATSMKGLLECFWKYERIGKLGRAATHAGEPYLAYAELCLRDGPALEALGLPPLPGQYGVRTGNLQELSDRLREIADANPPVGR